MEHVIHHAVRNCSFFLSHWSIFRERKRPISCVQVYNNFDPTRFQRGCFYIIINLSTNKVQQSEISLKKYMGADKKGRLYFEVLTPKITEKSAEITKYILELTKLLK